MASWQHVTLFCSTNISFIHPLHFSAASIFCYMSRQSHDELMTPMMCYSHSMLNRN